MRSRRVPLDLAHLPGPTAVRAVLALVLVAAVGARLPSVVFPYVEPFVPFADVTIDG